jgi:hypothetical protein
MHVMLILNTCYFGQVLGNRSLCRGLKYCITGDLKIKLNVSYIDVQRKISFQCPALFQSQNYFKNKHSQYLPPKKLEKSIDARTLIPVLV